LANAVGPGGPVVANGVVYAVSENDNVYAFDLAGGNTNTRRPAAGQLHPDYTHRPQNSTRF